MLNIFFNIFIFRLQRLEESLKDDSIPESQKDEKRNQHAAKETEFLRMKRSRLGVEDFDPLKVIGKGAFGEVKSTILMSLYISALFVKIFTVLYS